VNIAEVVQKVTEIYEYAQANGLTPSGAIDDLVGLHKLLQEIKSKFGSVENFVDQMYRTQRQVRQLSDLLPR